MSSILLGQSANVDGVSLVIQGDRGQEYGGKICDKSALLVNINNVEPLYIPRDNIHEINTPKCPIQTQCG